MRGWLLYLALGLLTYWLFFGQPDWASLLLWLAVVFWPLMLAWEIGWWLLKVALAVGLSLFLRRRRLRCLAAPAGPERHAGRTRRAQPGRTPRLPCVEPHPKY